MIKIEEFDELQKKLYSAVIADILDDFGLRNNVLASRCGYKLMLQNLLIFILYFNRIMGKRQIFFRPLFASD